LTELLGFSGDVAISATQVAVLCGAALATAVLSAVIGMAGGIVLLSVMLLFFEPLVAIPLHGVVQLVSNGSRTWIQRRHVRWGLLLWYGALLLPMGALGLAIAQSLPPTVLRAAIGVFVLLATWAPGALLLGAHPERTELRRRFFLLGGVVGLLNPTIGATGPLIAPFFLNLGLTRQSLIGTKAASQSLGHLAKLVVFGAAGFAFAPFALLLALLSGAVVAGTWLGSRVLESVNELWFTRLYKGVLTLIALRLVLVEGLAALGIR
jgi:uncharacterized membrane protein YfcA